MENAIEVKNLTKRYKNFLLDDICFNVPSGYICGFIGQNGAGKTTSLRLMLGMAMRDGGEVNILGKPNGDVSVKEDLGVLFDRPYYQPYWTPIRLEKALRSFYKRWDGEAYRRWLQKFLLDPKQKFKTLSRGMMMKLGLAAALSHDAKLLLLDEPTSGLDPVMRDQLLDILRDYIAEEGRSVFFSSHITSDLEKIADYIVYIHKGRIIYSGLKSELTEKYCVIRGGIGELPPKKRVQVIGFREHEHYFSGLIKSEDIGGLPSGIVTEKASLDEIMVHMDREEERTGA
ncbi:MAG: ABC transporter ATP-binding protein [Defluviitaleaceae bacterium]|nr:ABC transporter ATP-binding protein [Defluviitaleaceae bacterium]